MTSFLSRAAFALGLAFALAPAAVHAAAPKAGSNAPRSLEKTDTIVGSGKAATPGSTITVHYTGWLYAPKEAQRHGSQFDSSVGGKPFTFELGAGKVIKGLDEGLVGMKVGGKRTLVVPAALGYGSTGAGPVPPGANMIFEVTLLDVK